MLFYWRINKTSIVISNYCMIVSGLTRSSERNTRDAQVVNFTPGISNNMNLDIRCFLCPWRRTRCFSRTHFMYLLAIIRLLKSVNKRRGF